MADEAVRASEDRVSVIIPYFGYARADRKTSGRESITAKLTANLLEKSGVDRVLAMDLHSSLGLRPQLGLMPLKLLAHIGNKKGLGLWMSLLLPTLKIV